MRAQYHPQAADELNGAIAHYNSMQTGLGDALRLEVYATVERILERPRQHRIIENDVRRCFVHRFPFSVLFRLIGDELVRILTIRHHRQHEDHGLKRK